MPAGLSLNPTNCAITGIPTVATAATSYTITATNQYGNTTTTFTLTTTLVAPTAFSFPYTTGVTTIYTIGTPVNVSPAITGVVTNCVASPSLPAGLTLNTTDCSISGTPTTVSGATTYTITASNANGNVATTIKLQVNNVPPANLVYPFGSSTTLAVGTAVSISPTFTGGVTSCSPSPTLPTGLSINATTCTISGTPSAAKVATAYTITASNSFGNTNVIVTITAQLFPPSSVSFPFPGGTTSFTTGVAVNISATTSGVVTSCAVSPALPAGLNFNTTTCAITGTPTGISPATNYTITASNASGSANTTVTIAVNPPAPTNLVYPSSGNLAFPATIAKTVTPTVIGTVTNCVASPSLPAGLSIAPTTCVISGTATAEQNSTAYVITASNAGGNATANITITIAQPPLNLTYPTASTFGYKNNVAMSIAPSVAGNGITYSVSPALPTGISLNTSTGAISGTYAEFLGSTNSYTITATNAGGTATVTLTLSFFGKPTYQTGQIQCYDVSGNVISCAGTGQDGEYQAGQPAAVYSGPNQHATYTNDYTTTDMTSGLVWKTCMQGIDGADCSIDPLLHYGSIASCESLSSLNSNNGFAGKKDWRTASLIEIYKLFLFKNFKTGFVSFFPGLQSRQNYLVKNFISPNILDPAGECYFSEFNILNTSRSPMVWIGHGCSTFNPEGLVRCVSGTQQEKAPQFIDKNNGINLDIATGLSWTRCRLGASGADCQTGTPIKMSFHGALTACKNLTLGGKSWKVPNVLEALSLFNRVNYGFDYQMFPFDSSYEEDFWTSTPTASGLNSLAVIGFQSIGEKAINSSLQGVRCISTP